MNIRKNYNILPLLIIIMLISYASIKFYKGYYKFYRISDKQEILNSNIDSFKISKFYNSSCYDIYMNKQKITIYVDDKIPYKSQRLQYNKVDINGDIINGIYNVKNKNDIIFINNMIDKLNKK